MSVSRVTTTVALTPLGPGVSALTMSIDLSSHPGGQAIAMPCAVRSVTG